MEIERRLSNVLSEFAQTLVTEFPLEAIVDHLVLRIVDVLPISAAGVTLISHGQAPRYLAASGDSALRFEQLQSDLDQGPCLAAHRSGSVVAVPDLRSDGRFPQFAAQAIEQGLAAVFALPLCEADTRFGALDLYCTTPGELDIDAMVTAQTLAYVTSAYMLNAQARADLREASSRAHHIALHDALTGLPNRTLLVQRLDHAILRCRREHAAVGLLFVDLDDFRSINDAHGHEVGDELLVAVAERLTALLRPGDTLARMVGDEFVILCEDLHDQSQIEPIADRVDAALATPFALVGARIEISASVGIAFASEGSELTEQVLQSANLAMRQAKQHGGSNHSIVDPGERTLQSVRRDLHHDLRGAIARSELQVAYQPIVATGNGRVTGVEALLRWEHPTHGAVPPSTMIPLAEQSGQIGTIGRWILARACADQHAWNAEVHRPQVAMSVNVSALQLMARGFVNSVGAILATTNVAPELLTLEVTENVFVQDSDRALVVLRGLKDLGVSIALDDFGTGYSSLSYLKQFPVDIVKIDRCFITDIHTNPTSLHIVGAVVDLAHGLGLKVVAEGVETSEQHEQAFSLGCDYCQGFYFQRPCDPAQLTELLATGVEELHLPRRYVGAIV